MVAALYLIQNMIFLVVKTTTDPCTNHTILSDDTRSAIRELGETETESCDRNLKQAWYKLEDPTLGNVTDMPTECIPIMRCGSSAPIWLNGI